MPCYICGMRVGLTTIGAYQLCQTHRLMYGRRRKGEDQGKLYLQTIEAMKREYDAKHEGVRDE